MLYLDGKGVAADTAEAIRWTGTAAEHGDANSQANLGMFLLNGTGLTADTAGAVGWFEKAADQNPDQIEKANHLASEWKASHKTK